MSDLFDHADIQDGRVCGRCVHYRPPGRGGFVGLRGEVGYCDSRKAWEKPANAACDRLTEQRAAA